MLITAVVQGHLKLATLLLEHGADPDSAGAHGRTSLHVAAEQGRLDMVNLLLKHGARVDAASGFDSFAHGADDLV